VHSRLIHAEAGQQTFVLVFETGDEAMEGLSGFARERALSAAHFTGIGAFSDAELGYFDWQEKEYRPIRVDEQVEVVALVGDVALQDGEPAVHAHCVVARSDGSVRGGHLLLGHVRPTLEVVLSESPAHLRKRHDEASGLALIALDDPADAAATEPGA
jgi:predicted DNA-binding protein with PD1-like motif